jgi:hypothetical protein
MAERDEVDRATGARRMVAPRHVKLGDRMILQTARFAIVANPDAGDEPYSSLNTSGSSRRWANTSWLKRSNRLESGPLRSQERCNAHL